MTKKYEHQTYRQIFRRSERQDLHTLIDRLIFLINKETDITKKDVIYMLKMIDGIQEVEDD